MDAIVLHGVKTHNLKNLDLVLEHKKLYVLTGVSGSGKSSLAFDTLYAEGQRRYVESLSAYARQFLERMEKPDVESVSGIPPALAIEAKNTINNARSTVGTQTEINDYLRVLFARAGEVFCPDCGLKVVRNHPESIADYLLQQHAGKKIWILFKVGLDGGAKKYLAEAMAELERQGFYEYFQDDQMMDAGAVLARKGISKQGLYAALDSLEVSPKSRQRLVDALESAPDRGRGETAVWNGAQLLLFSEGLKCPGCRREFREPTPNLFSFNSPLGACPACQGFGRIITIDWDLVVPDPRKSLEAGAVEPWTKPSSEWEFRQMIQFCRRKKIPADKPWSELSEAQRKTILFGAKGEEYFSVKDFYDFLEKKTYKMHVRIFLSKYRGYIPCSDCGATRLKPDALAVRVSGLTIHEMMDLSIEDLYRFIEGLRFRPEDHERVEPVYLEIKKRVRFLKEVGLGYLSLTRLSRTLSGGEVQRIHLASSLGSALVDTLYVLDEPSIGLHERDNDLLIRLLKELRDLGNTVVVVEHDRAMIEAADEVLDLGPQGGEKGGRLLFQGPVKDIVRAPQSLTGQYFSGAMEIKRRTLGAPVPKKKNEIVIQGAEQHNLSGLNVRFPLHRLTVLTGVSGSGKSTLLYDILYHHYLRFKGQAVQEIGKVKSIRGFEGVDEMVLIDQSPIGRTPRSNPVTYLKAFDDIRKLFAASPQAKREGFGAGHFSFNVDGGRCPECKGDGRIKVEMHFLADVFIPCEACQAKRFKPEILEVEYKDKNIDQVLAMTVDEGLEFFRGEKNLSAKLELLQRVGLGYLRLGQSATTLSGGEAQRLKLAAEMIERRSRHVVYLFDEPTTGLHYHDIQSLMGAFDELLEKGHSLIVIEHNMEVIRCADWVVDLGPEGGNQGGQLIYEGPVEGLLECPKSFTGIYLKKYKTLRERSRSRAI